MGCAAGVSRRKCWAEEAAIRVQPAALAKTSSSASTCPSSCASPHAASDGASPAAQSPSFRSRGGLSEVHLALLRQIFDLADRNMDGRLTKRELLIALKRHPPVRGLFDLSAKDMEEVQNDFEDQGRLGKAERSWSNLDTNNDKTVTWDEFADHFAGQPQQSLKGIALLKAQQGSTPLSQRPRFVPSKDWQIVPRGALCPPGLEYKMDLQTGQTLARAF
uniref:EF-hand domain-containing protein n=1 Tax=Alexandrium catenella TaxID=2925 RepID=A0A7S1S7X4_ALECA|mmetsp:Transcript_89677/g.238221  ORF Transcript_89677/g.238221 Transcript_89677/m.238221 type:complete len:219 (+) Transcript_89677:76-732(+)|eukprot:CAMPEP_0171211812 /NCGR_PEP_ID=MMETSP0790-20130122/29814_1 /TAXON_ID=2925 /ORGANISM="Alexandrium catenella, Strain OF101" /LENGTH=218 /DNA_ID=CAMNT_0011677485 /DNA_START=6 /DNA_END=662 /DNA_ORIENTATION=-